METTTIQSKEEVAKEIGKIYEAMFEAAQKPNDEKAPSIWTEDGINMPIYGVTQNIHEMMMFIQDITENKRWEFVEYKPLELFVHDDMAYEFSLLEHNLHPNDGSETVNTKMRCISVYKRDNGKWKLHRWMPQYSDN